MVANIGNAIAAKFGILSKRLHAAQLAINNINIQLVFRKQEVVKLILLTLIGMKD
jgi:hypothetical protein